MTIQLVVTRPFLSYRKGDIIAISDQVQQLLEAGYSRFVLKVAAPSATRS